MYAKYNKTEKKKFWEILLQSLSSTVDMDE